MELIQTPQFNKDLSILTEMADVSAQEATRRAVHLAAELMVHQREGGILILAPRRWWSFTKWERIRFSF